MDASFATTPPDSPGGVLDLDLVHLTRPSRRENRGSTRIVMLAGEYDSATAVELGDAIRAAGDHDIVVDMGAVTFVDASTIGILVAARNRLRVKGCALTLRGASPCVLRLLTICALTDFLHPSMGVLLRQGPGRNGS